jgi:hypothetical protein
MSTAAMAKKTKSAKGPKPRTRRERRFEPLASARPGLVYALGGIGAAAMGAGAWEQFGPLMSDSPIEPLKWGPYVLTAGAALAGFAIWTGTSGEPLLRVGDGGIGVEKGAVRRMPWFAVERIEWRDEAVRVAGKDDAGVAMTVVASLRSQPQAAAWIVKEARARVPGVVEVPEDSTLPEPATDAGESLTLDPPQVVGRHCAASGKVISYEPDARVCPRCERVYHRAHVPAACACGASLAELQPAPKTA